MHPYTEGASTKSCKPCCRYGATLHAMVLDLVTDYESMRPLTAMGDLGLGLGIWDLGLLRGSRNATSVTAMSDVT